MPPLWTLVYPRLRTHPDRSTTKPVAVSLTGRARPAVSPRPSLHSPIARCPAPGPAGGEHDRGEFTTDRAPVGSLLEHREHPAAGDRAGCHLVRDVALQIHWQLGSWSSTLRLRLPDNAEPRTCVATVVRAGWGGALRAYRWGGILGPLSAYRLLSRFLLGVNF